MKNLLFFVSVLFVLTASRCSKESFFELGVPVEFRLGQTTQCKCGELSLTVVDIKEDSRCPLNTNCLWEGQAVVLLEANGQEFELTAREGHPQIASREVGGFIFRLQKVSPYPEAGKKIEKPEYRIELLVEQP
jgi:hypothetical protein